MSHAPEYNCPPVCGECRRAHRGPCQPDQPGALALGTGWTAPSAIPPDVARKIIAARDAIANEDTSEAWHQLYSIADPSFESVTPWAILEAKSNVKDEPRP